ncbi:DNA polymerase III subunit gamma and tau [Nocardioides sp. WL0053]|uniref:DNA polymerase III subunit gamma/tau n=1 Tax=Nocardioides jiangsuensis TaxID=2866161 RepID=A0ABS7RHW1_9ACTN|nr:DNA polymerase III subunit gamma and tau [Nocardioides jiangsuensis]MBY9074366.1 DNA polymerase III subunit gamma and tau [Nocardioides jiangsuensis]
MEAPLALYRRYRPETFAEVIGQDHVTTPLRSALANNRVNHAYLFSGPRGCGKTTSARILARALNCEKGPIAEPCGQCRSCTDLARGGPGSIDVIEIDAASHGGVDDARDLRERAFFAPVNSRYKVYIIDEAHMVSTQGFNALLKLVEEPPPHLKFIFATTEPEKVIGTIRSRTHHYPFRLIPPRVLSAYLAELCEQEGVRIDPAALPLVVRAGGGSARDTLSVLDQLLGGAGDDGVTYELTTGLLGFTPDALLDEVVDAFAAHDGGTVFGVVDKVIETGQDPRRFTEDLLRRLRDLVIISAVPDASATGLIDVPEDQGERLVAQSARFGRHDLTRAADLVAAGLTEMRGATAPRLLLELICARVLLPGADDSTEGVLARIDRIEKRMSIEGGVPSSAAPAQQAPAVRRPAAPEPQTAPPSSAPTQQPAAPTASAPAPESRAVNGPAAQQGAPRPAAEPRDAEPVQTSGSQPQAWPAPAQPGQPAAQGPAAPPEAPEQTAPEPAQPTAPAPEQPAPAESAPSGGLGLVEVRRLWPDLLDAVKLKRRYTWILLSQNAQVAAVDDKTLTIALVNAGARNSFMSGGSEEILRQAAIDVIGQSWRIEAIVDPSAQPGADPASEPRVVRPAVQEQQPAPGPDQSATPGPTADPAMPPAADTPPGTAGSPPVPPPVDLARQPIDPSAIASAREAIQPTRAAGAVGPKGPSVSDTDAHPDDPDADDHGLGGAQLLERELGARIIEEIRHD